MCLRFLHIDYILSWRKIGLSFMIRVIGLENIYTPFPVFNREDYCAITGCSNTACQIGRFGKAVNIHLFSKSKAIRAAWARASSKESF